MTHDARWTLMASIAATLWVSALPAGAQSTKQQQGGTTYGQGAPGPSEYGVGSRPQVAGKVASVDARRNEVSLDSGRKLALATQARILESGHQIAIDEIQPGDQVRASFDARGQVDRVEVAQSAASLRRRERDGWGGSG